MKQTKAENKLKISSLKSSLKAKAPLNEQLEELKQK